MTKHKLYKDKEACTETTTLYSNFFRSLNLSEAATYLMCTGKSNQGKERSIHITLDLTRNNRLKTCMDELSTGFG